MSFKILLHARKAFLFLCGTLVLSACASSGSTVQHYMLPQAAVLPAQATRDAPVLLLAPIALSDLVDRRGLLMQINDIQVQEAVQHQWAEGLSQQLQRRLRVALAQHLASWNVASLGSSSAMGYRLLLEVDQFHGRFDGQAVLSGRWRVLDKQQQEVSAQSFLLTEALERDGYPALVHSLDRAWQALAVQIAQALASVAKSGPKSS